MKYLYITLALGTTALHGMEQPVEPRRTVVEKIASGYSSLRLKREQAIIQSKNSIEEEYKNEIQYFTKMK